MTRVRAVVLGVCAAMLVGLFATFVAVGSSFSARAAGPNQSLPEPRSGTCPKQPPQRLPGNALAGATVAALAEARVIYRDLNLKGMRATAVILAVDDPARGSFAGLNCGPRVQSRTIVVYLQFPALRPSASLSQGVVLVSRFSGQYRVWTQLH